MPIELIRLCKSFDGRAVISGLTHSFPDGRITCITGSSGCGKTTLLRMLMGLTQPDSGEIRGLQNRPMAAVFQEDRLLAQLSAFDNVRIVLRRDTPRQRILDALDAVGLSEAAHLPACTLSGGMKRRTALVRALLCDAPLVLLDEPFNGLDAAARSQALQFALPLLAGRTALIVTHHPEALTAPDVLFWNMQNG